MKRIPLLIIALALGACDSEPEDADEARFAELVEADEAPDGPPPHRMRHRRSPVEHVCGVVECSDDQRTQLEAAFVPPARPEREALEAADAALAEAFAGENFSVQDLEARAKLHPRPARGHRLEMLGLVHDVLTPDQRVAFAGALADGEVFEHGKHRGRRGHHASPERRARMAAHLCVELDCDAEQAEQVEAIVTRESDAKPDREAHDAFRKAVSDAFATDTFDAEALAEQLPGDRQAHHAEKAARMVEIHALLTPEQRASVAERIAERGPRALMGGRGRGHHRGGRGRHHG
ncbi:MAG: Spy/CpxP family protein refolding chaperone [Myxococcota bacterium]